jgi:nicotinamidase-related amidase
MIVKADYYQQFDADPSLDVPGEGYGGWKSAEIEIGRAALVVMHAWEAGTPDEYPGWFRCVEYIPRAQQICREVFPPLLSACRERGFPVFHVVGGKDYWSHLPGHKRAVELAGDGSSPLPSALADESLSALREFRRKHVFVGLHNEPDVNRGFEKLDFDPHARPIGDDGVAENAEQLHALAVEQEVNHLVYIGFAINWCLLMSPGGMLDMSRRGYLCSTIREATTAVENRETAREELCKQEALWRVALAFGFVLRAQDFTEALLKSELARARQGSRS